MTFNVWTMLKHEYEEFTRGKCPNSNNQQIESSENQIGLKFSQSFKYFLKYHQCSAIGEIDMGTLNPSESSSSVLWSLPQLDKWFKEEQAWPNIENWIIISKSDGDPIGIKPNGEVWISYHDSNFEQEKLADDFEDFVYKLLTETLWD